MKALWRTVLFAALAGTAVPHGAVAMDLKAKVHGAYRQVGEARNWTVIRSSAESSEGGGACAIFAKPDSSEVLADGATSDALRGELAAFVNWNEEKPDRRSGEISFLIGALVQEGPVQEHRLQVSNGVMLQLIGVGDRLYVDPEDDRRAIAAFRAANSIVVEGRLRDGRIIRDSYSLLGVQAATSLAMSGCR